MFRESSNKRFFEALQNYHFKGLPFLVTKQSTIEKLCLLFFFLAMVNINKTTFYLSRQGADDGKEESSVILGACMRMCAHPVKIFKINNYHMGAS